MKLFASCSLLFLAVGSTTSVNAQPSAPVKVPGLGVTFTVDKATDSTSRPNVWLYVPAGQPATPFVPAGKFTATWTGFIGVDLRGDFGFQAELNGAIKLELNGKPILEATTNGVATAAAPIRLNKGNTNTITVTYTSPAEGDAFLRLHWQPRDSFFQPIPLSSLTHLATAEELAAAKVRHGRELFIDLRCVKCHAPDKSSTLIPELAMDAPSLEAIGARRNVDWMARWIQDPKSLRPTAHMPQVFHGDKAKDEAVAVAAYLASLSTAASPVPAPDAALAADGKKLFDTLHCVACHNAPDSTEADAKKISLKLVAAKFAPGTLAEFLKQPNAHYTWIRMPNFKLDDAQRNHLAAYLQTYADKAITGTAPTEKAVLELGQKLVQTSGCLNCHNLKQENQFVPKALVELKDWKLGCLAEKAEGKAPHYTLTKEEREDLQAFAASDRLSLTRQALAEDSARLSQTLNCRSCHGQFEGFPHFEILGGKLKPEWAAKFIGGEVAYKPRPWLESQMPAFPAYASLLAQGMTMEHGYPAQTPAEKAIDEKAGEIGNHLVVGFSCTSCHSIGQFGATQVFEAPGINLAYSGERLQHHFFHQWVRNPPSLDPNTKMPVYFDEQGKSPLADVLEGDGVKQIESLWQYVRQGEKMAAPKAE